MNKYRALSTLLIGLASLPLNFCVLISCNQDSIKIGEPSQKTVEGNTLWEEREGEVKLLSSEAIFGYFSINKAEKLDTLKVKCEEVGSSLLAIDKVEILKEDNNQKFKIRVNMQNNNVFAGKYRLRITISNNKTKKVYFKSSKYYVEFKTKIVPLWNPDKIVYPEEGIVPKTYYAYMPVDLYLVNKNRDKNCQIRFWNDGEDYKTVEGRILPDDLYNNPETFLDCQAYIEKSDPLDPLTIKDYMVIQWETFIVTTLETHFKFGLFYDYGLATQQTLLEPDDHNLVTLQINI